MNRNIFNFSRFGKYFKSDLRTCTANYGLSLITLSVLSFMALYVCYTVCCLIFEGEWNGPGMASRAVVFGIVIFCITITMPGKCYGRITEKQYGTFWLTLPASKLEKFVSMLIITCIIAPVTGVVLYLFVDSLICLLDPTCGNSILYGISQLKPLVQEFIANEMDEVQSEAPFLLDFIKQFSNPLLYIDEIFGMTLPFLLGALIFKNGKVVKTFLSLAAISMVLSMIMSPLSVAWSNSIMETAELADPTMNDIEAIFDNWIFRNIALVDTISDTIANGIVLVAIFFRIKTLKH